MKKISIYTFLVVALSFFNDVKAQSTSSKDTLMQRTVVVEKEYMPEMEQHYKINVNPINQPPTKVDREVVYEVSDKKLSITNRNTLGIVKYEPLLERLKKGFFRAGIGTHGLVDVLFDYTPISSSINELNLYYSLEGLNYKLENGMKRRRYNNNAIVGYKHLFDEMALSVSGRYRLDNYTLYSHSLDYMQRFSNIGLSANLENIPFSSTISLNVGLDFEHSNQYNHQLVRNHTLMINDTLVSLSENRLGVNLLTAMNMTDVSSFILGTKLNIYGYSNTFSSDRRIGNSFDDYVTLLLSPYYQLLKDNMTLKAGANVSVITRLSPSFQISPLVEFEYNFADTYKLTANLSSSHKDNTIERILQVNPYLQNLKSKDTNNTMIVNQPSPTIEIVNSYLGLSGSPIDGLWFSVGGGYVFTKNDLMATNTHFFSGSTDQYFLTLAGSYDYKGIAGISADYTFRKWNSINSEIMLLTKPHNELNAELFVNPLKNLSVKVGYSYIQRKAMNEGTYVYQYFDRLPNISNLYSLISYKINLPLPVSIWLKADNLLRADNQYYHKYPSMPLNVMGGLEVQF